MKKLLIYLLFFSSFLQSQVVSVEDLEYNKITDKNSGLYISNTYFNITNYAVSKEYSIIYSKNRFSFYLIDNKTKLIIDEKQVLNKKIIENNKMFFENEFVFSDGMNSKISKISPPVNFKNISFINDSLVFAGFIYGKKKLYSLFLQITEDNKIKNIIQEIDLEIFFERKIKRKESVNIMTELRLHNRNVTATSINELVFTIDVSLQNILKERTERTEHKYYVYMLNTKTNKIALKYTDEKINEHIDYKYKLLYSNNFFIQFLATIDKLLVYNDKFDSISTLKMVNNNLYKDVIFPDMLDITYLIKNNFTNQIYLIKGGWLNKDYKYFISEIYINKSTVNSKLLKIITSHKQILFNTVINSNLIYSFKGETNTIYYTYLYNNLYEDNIFSLKTTYNNEDNLLSHDDKYLLPDLTKLNKLYGVIKKDNKSYPSKTINELLHSLIELNKELNFGYAYMYLHAFHNYQIIQMNRAIDNGSAEVELNNNLINFNNIAKENIDLFNKIIKLLNTDSMVFVNENHIRIFFVNTDSKEEYIDFVRIKQKWRIGNYNTIKK